jgi:hypothetical protein
VCILPPRPDQPDSGSPRKPPDYGWPMFLGAVLFAILAALRMAWELW